MSLRLPPLNSELRSFFDVADLAMIAAPAVRRNLPTLREAMRSAASFLADEPLAKAVQSIVLRADGTVELHQFTRRTHRPLWNFGG